MQGKLLCRIEPKDKIVIVALVLCRVFAIAYTIVGVFGKSNCEKLSREFDMRIKPQRYLIEKALFQWSTMS
jgi:hypothetical protein